MVKLSPKQVNEIAQELECGMKCYVNKDTGEFRSILDWDDMMDDDGLWEEELKEIEANWTNYVVVEKMPSHAAFKVMEGFADQVADAKMQRRLFGALNQRNPFRIFKYELDYDQDLKQRWFDYHLKAYEAYVRDELSEDFEL